jgi:hypothetical protein
MSRKRSSVSIVIWMIFRRQERCKILYEESLRTEVEEKGWTRTLEIMDGGVERERNLLRG